MRLRCPVCRDQPRRALHRRLPGDGPAGVLLCLRCQTPLERPRPWPVAPLTMGLLVLTAALTAALSRPLRLAEAPATTATSRHMLMATAEAELMEQLAVADQQWRPKVQALPGGGMRYLYRKRSGDPDLSIDQIKMLIQNPPTFVWERRVIRDLWRRLSELGVDLQLAQPRKSGAAAEWDPSWQALRIKPAVVNKGSSEFARVLNHEAIHVAQSCAAGSTRANPRPLGLPKQMPAHLHSVLLQPTYAKAGERELQLEREAYANQDQLGLGLSLINLHC